MSRLSILTPTTGSSDLKRAINGVQNQILESPDDVEHIIIIDGDHTDKVKKILDEVNLKNVETRVIEIPWQTGMDGYNGHRIYGAMGFLVNSPYVMFLDEDNWFEPNHYQTLAKPVIEKQYDWGYALRNIYDSEGGFVCQDNCESLGFWNTILGQDDYLVDVNCFCMKTRLAWETSSLWYRRAKVPGVIPADRTITKTLLFRGLTYLCSGCYTVNYKTGNSPKSVQHKFFIDGEKKMRERWSKHLEEHKCFPWETQNN